MGWLQQERELAGFGGSTRTDSDFDVAGVRRVSPHGVFVGSVHPLHGIAHVCRMDDRRLFQSRSQAQCACFLRQNSTLYPKALQTIQIMNGAVNMEIPLYRPSRQHITQRQTSSQTRQIASD